MHRMACRSFYSPPSFLQTFSRRYATQKRPLSNSRVLNLSIPGFSRSSAPPPPADASSNNAYIRGGYSQIAWATVKSYTVSQLSTLHDWNFLSYVTYVEKVDVKAYPNDQFVHTNIPPLVISQLLKLSVARSIASSHGIATASAKLHPSGTSGDYLSEIPFSHNDIIILSQFECHPFLVI